MKKNNLPIKIVLQKTTDIQHNQGGGNSKFFCDVTPELQKEIAFKFQALSKFYENVFDENELVPAVGKIIVKPEAIAKSHKPKELCKKCPIIGSDDLNEIYIKITKKSIKETVQLVNKISSEKIKANLTVISDIQPIFAETKISNDILVSAEKKKFKNKIKIKLFDFIDDFDNDQIKNYVKQKIKLLGFESTYELISYGEKINFIKLEVNSYDDVIKLASINGIKSIGYFQEYSLPLGTTGKPEAEILLDTKKKPSNTIIGIIDGGISLNNKYLSNYIIGKEVYVDEMYQNPSHATFIASMIQYGNVLNEIKETQSKTFNFVDIVAIPNSDPEYGATDTIGEEELMEIIEETMVKYSSKVKIWNLSLGIESKICNNNMSDLGVFLDYIQDEYQVQIFVSSGNISKPPFRDWPVPADFDNSDKIISPADSIRAITVGSIALYDSSDSIVKKDEPSPFSRRGPGVSYTVKPDIVDYGGNLSYKSGIKNLGMKGLSENGEIVEGIGTSYANPRGVQKFASVYDEMVDKDILLAKAMLIHSARMNSRAFLDNSQNNIKYYGFGIPPIDVENIIKCNESEVTLIFRQKIPQSSYLEMFDFPYPKSLIKNGRYYGEIGMTLVYNPILDSRYGKEYCRVNVDVSFGTYKYDAKTSKINYKGQIPLECSWDEKFEKNRVENGFKWSPIKSYYRKIVNGIEGEGWKIRIDMSPRDDVTILSQDFVLVVTIKDLNGNDIYSELVNELKLKGYTTNNLETKQQLRPR